MVKTEETPDSAQLLRDILQNKEKQIQEHLGNNNSIKDLCSNIQKRCETSDLEKMTMKAMATTYRGDNHEQDSEHSSEELSCDGSEYESDHNQMMDELDGSESTYDMKNNDRNSIDGDENKEAKRARVENILSHIRQSPPGDQGDNHSQEVRRQKRKQYQPQQHDSKFPDHSGKKCRKLERLALQDQLLQLQHQLQLVQKRYIALQYDDDQGNVDEENENENQSHFQLKMNLDKPLFSHNGLENEQFQNNQLNNVSEKLNGHYEGPSHSQQRLAEPLQQLDVSNLTNTLKTKITDAVSNAVESVVCDLLNNKSKRVENEKPKSKPEPEPSPVKEIPEKIKEEKPRQATPQPFLRASPMREPFHDHIGNMARILEKASAFEPPRGLTPDLHRPPHLHPTLPFHLPPFSYFPQSHLLHPPSIYSCAPLSEPEQTEALPLVVNTPKKKRTKVTDTRISPKTARALLGQDPMSFAHHMEQAEQRHHITSFPGLIPHHLPTSVAIPNPSLQHSDILGFYRDHPFGDPRSNNHSPLHADHPSPSCSVSSPSDSIGQKFMNEMYDCGSDSFEGHHIHVISFLK